MYGPNGGGGGGVVGAGVVGASVVGIQVTLVGMVALVDIVSFVSLACGEKQQLN